MDRSRCASDPRTSQSTLTPRALPHAEPSAMMDPRQSTTVPKVSKTSAFTEVCAAKILMDKLGRSNAADQQKSRRPIFQSILSRSYYQRSYKCVSPLSRSRISVVSISELYRQRQFPPRVAG